MSRTVPESLHHVLHAKEKYAFFFHVEVHAEILLLIFVS